MEWPAGTRRLIIASYLFYLRVCARTHSPLSYADPEQRKRGIKRERERERGTEWCSHKSKFHFNVLTKDQIKHFNWRFYGGRQPKSNCCLHPAWPCRLVRSREYACTRTTYPYSPLSASALLFSPSLYFPRVAPSWSRKKGPLVRIRRVMRRMPLCTTRTNITK